MFKDPSHLEPKCIQIKLWLWRHFECFFVEVKITMYFVIIELNLKSFFFSDILYRSFHVSEKENNIKSYKV
jgi:hypothetical protein